MTDNKNTVLYQNKEYSIGNDKELYNPYNKPLTDIIYELAKELESWKLQATSLSYADEICALEIDLEHKNQELDLYKTWYRAKHGDLKDYLMKLKTEKEQAEQKLESVIQMLKNGVKIHDDIIVNKSILQIIDEVIPNEN